MPLRAAPDAALHLIAPRDMPVWTLRYLDRHFGVEKRVEFLAPDVAAALAIAESEPVGPWAFLCRDGAIVCRMGGEPGGATAYWVAD